MCGFPNEKPLCFSCLFVRIVVQDKGRTQFYDRRFHMWLCHLYPCWSVSDSPLQKLYAKGATFICAFERSLAICIPHRPITFPLSYGTFFHFLPSDKRTAVGHSQRPCYTQLIHRYHMGALTLLGLGPFPTNLGETYVAFSAHCCLESRCPHLHPSHYNKINHTRPLLVFAFYERKYLVNILL